MDYQTQPEGPEIADQRGQRLARGLGMFSLGLGLTEVMAPRALARLIGVQPSGATSLILRALGARELGHGIGIFARPKTVWTRLIGDAIDVACVALALRGGKRSRLWPTMGALAAVGALDALATMRMVRSRLGKPVTSSMTINRSADECYRRWRNFSQLPQFMRYLENVTELDDRRSRWVAKSPIGTLEWEAEITGELPGRSIAWHSVTPQMPLRGRVTFEAAPGGRGTEVCVEIQTAPFAKLFTHAEVNGDLRRFKQVLETGEVVAS